MPMPAAQGRFDFLNPHGERLAGLLEGPVEPRALALFAHCFTCSKTIGAATRIARALAARDIAVLRFDFTGLGNSEGDFENTNFSSNVADLVAAADHLRRQGRAPDLLIGHSLGGAAVIAAAKAIPECRGVVTIAAPSDPGHVRHLFQESLETIIEDGEALVDLAGRRFTITRQFIDDIAEKNLREDLRTLRRPLLIFHSPVDEIVSIEHARHIYDAARHPKSFISLCQADHLITNPADSDYVAEVIAAWASRYIADATE
ncbi:alpha/beta hydrolase family protein [Thiococcus pfennigii]|uniref:alpha/beta hydrolase family protein n=1 Tax=Thiococcus pfennigii TaxID=1057 RepID=UPI001907D9CE|nr:alpha/beta hydrolase [Thiococcus pfennigii]MBK1702619.1 osmotically inducible protein OsmC [Thiococcus pfennigii]MBK1733256.1 osmotically inducible protein OsmC [Thiococcus pfennigii]